jgi:cephalosporin hydroxylase
MLAGSLSRPQKDLIIKAYRRMTWLAKWPWRGILRATIETRTPIIPGRRWRSSISPKTHLGLVNGSIKYTYRGVRMVKHPVDIALYMKLLWELKPRTVIEIGSKDGGTAAWFGDMFKLWGMIGLVLSIDLYPPKRPYFCTGAVKFVQGDERNLEPHRKTFEDLPHPWILINDASHNSDATLKCMRFMHQFLEKGDYFVIEDSILTEMGLDWDGERRGGPALAIARFLKEHPDCYEVDARYCDHFGYNVTANMNGYLRRV